MEKLVYLLDRANTPGALRTELLRDSLPALQALGARQLVINVADLDEPVAGEAPQRIAGHWQELGAVVSLWLDSVDQHPAIEVVLAKTGCRAAGYLVTESVPQAYRRDWPAGERRPGVTQFTAHGKPADVDEADFFRHWQDHTRLSFDLHPHRWSYVRNAVARSLSPDNAPYRALVLEHFRTLADFTDEARYFGDPAVVQQMYEELPGFCDVTTMITGPMSEYGFD